MKNIKTFEKFDTFNTNSFIYNDETMKYKALEILTDNLSEEEVEELLDGDAHIQSVLNQIDTHPYSNENMVKFIQTIREYGI